MWEDIIYWHDSTTWNISIRRQTHSWYLFTIYIQRNSIDMLPNLTWIHTKYIHMDEMAKSHPIHPWFLSTNLSYIKIIQLAQCDGLERFQSVQPMTWQFLRHIPHVWPRLWIGTDACKCYHCYGDDFICSLSRGRWETLVQHIFWPVEKCRVWIRSPGCFPISTSNVNTPKL